MDASTCITIIKMLLERLIPMVEKMGRDQLNLFLQSTEEAESLASKLKMIQEVLDDAESNSITDRKVEAWLEKMKDTAYEMDDVLEELEAKMVESMDPEGSADPNIYVSQYLLNILSPLFRSRSVYHPGIALKIKNLNGRLQSIAKQINDEFSFLPNVHKAKDLEDSHENKRTLTSSYFDVKDVCEIKGRDEEKDNITSKLLSMCSRDDDRLQIVSIVGLGGLGKTTLARLVFNDSDVKEYFDKTIWVCASHPFNEVAIANSILKKLNQGSQYENDLQVLLQGIETSVKGKRILLVLDDVWPHDERKWNQLRNCINKGAPGSRILVTTRNLRVAQSVGTLTVDIIPLQLLSDQSCWSLLSQVAFTPEGQEDPRKREIGSEIVKRRKGLPLAAKTLGSLLQNKRSVKEWEHVLESQIWELEVVKVDLFPHLYLSYNELRPAVKRCFLYCAMFPKDTEINVSRLIAIWMAQGFLSIEGGDEMELKGREYFEDLAVRFFFQDLEKDAFGDIVSCKMHDIVHDFAQFLTKNECFVVESLDDVSKLESSSRNVRHLTLLIDKGKCSSPISVRALEKLRSFHCRRSLPPHVLGNLKRVRNLSLSECELEELSPDIRNLIHLRYLDLSHNSLRQLPKAMCYLYHLQTLNLDRCSNLSNLPEEIHKLTELRHLVVKSKVSFPQGLEKLICLRTLATFRASRGGNKLGYLKHLNQLERLDMVIDNLTEEFEAIEATEAELKSKNRLVYLGLELRGEVSLRVMEALEPPPCLSMLLLEGYVGFKFPRWMTTSLHNLKVLYLVKCSSLPPLATLESLEELGIGETEEMECLGHEFLGVNNVVAFPKLKKLWFDECPHWTKWEDIGKDSMEIIMPCLRELRVTGCPNLESLPNRLLHRMPLQYLNISGSHTLIEQYRSKGGFEFLSRNCETDLLTPCYLFRNKFYGRM